VLLLCLWQTEIRQNHKIEHVSDPAQGEAQDMKLSFLELLAANSDTAQVIVILA